MAVKKGMATGQSANEHRSRPFSGVTLIELLVVLAIIGLLIAIAVPAVQQARENSGRVACANNLKQIGTALHAYLAAQGVFPPGAMGGSDWGYWHANVALLPHLELAALYNSLNLGLKGSDAANTTGGYRSVSVLLCPSDAAAMTKSYGLTNYSECVGTGRWAGGPDDICTGFPVPQDGLFAETRPFGSADCRDGLSHTAAFSEMVHGDGGAPRPVSRPKPSLGAIYEFLVLSQTQRELLDMCANVSGLTNVQIWPAGFPWYGDGRMAYTHLRPPGEHSCFGGNLGSIFSPITANSRHREGVNLLLADGHVRFVSNSIDLGAWQALASRNGGEKDHAF
jgi:prepilin-type N-terminal cleavage/methylation domain-containing protein/prepilin-type processing-associated H-X9-DG protein